MGEKIWNRINRFNYELCISRIRLNEIIAGVFKNNYGSIRKFITVAYKMILNNGECKYGQEISDSCIFIKHKVDALNL